MLKFPAYIVAGLAALFFGLANAASPASAKTICLGPSWSGVPASGKQKLQSELRSQGTISSGDSLSACSAPSSLGARPNPSRKARCLKDCADLQTGIQVACILAGLFVPGLAAACTAASTGAAGVCPATCASKYGS